VAPLGLLLLYKPEGHHDDAWTIITLTSFEYAASTSTAGGLGAANARYSCHKSPDTGGTTVA
jgi:hypothetical protein